MVVAFDQLADDRGPAKVDPKIGKWPLASRAALIAGSSVALWGGIFALIR